MEFFGYRIEKISGTEIRELEEAKRVLEKHGFRAVKRSADTSKKREAAAKANATKMAQAREKMKKGLELWRSEGDQEKKLTPYKLAQLSGVSKNTAKKFLEEIEAI
jgi:Fic family protein